MELTWGPERALPELYADPFEAKVSLFHNVTSMAFCFYVDVGDHTFDNLSFLVPVISTIVLSSY